MSRLLLSLLAVQTLISVVGAWLTWKVRAGEQHWGWLYVPAALSATLWILSSQRAQRLGLLGVVWDILVAGAYLGVFVAMGEEWTWQHLVGAALALLGIALMSS